MPGCGSSLIRAGGRFSALRHLPLRIAMRLLVLPALHPSMSAVYHTKVERLAEALDHGDEEQREVAREAVRGFITAILIPDGDGLLEVRGDLGKMLAAAAGEPAGSALAAVAYDGCGGSQPAEFGVFLGRSVGE